MCFEPPVILSVNVKISGLSSFDLKREYGFIEFDFSF